LSVLFCTYSLKTATVMVFIGTMRKIEEMENSKFKFAPHH